MEKVRVPGPQAWQALVNATSGRWNPDRELRSQTPAHLDHTPKFSLAEQDTFFCIGSCFARNVEEHLLYRDIEVLSKRMICPAAEWPNRPNGMVNKFTTHSILNEIEWTANIPAVGEDYFENGVLGWTDLQLAPNVRPVSLERAIERRTYLMLDYFARLREASVVVVTLGLNEAWYDHELQRYLNTAPNYYSVRRNANRYSLNITDVDQNTPWSVSLSSSSAFAPPRV